MNRTRRRTRLTTVITLAAVLVASACVAATGQAGPGSQGPRRGEPALPVVFVHGGSGSAAQYETQAMRWASNNYPNVVRAIDRISATPAVIQPILDDFFDAVMDETGDDQIYVVGHSQGVAVMNAYLDSSPERAARVAKYIGIDSASGPSPDRCPGGEDAAGNWVVPCAGVFGRGDPARRFGPDRSVQFADQGHVEVVGSPESFVAQYEFFTGRRPRTTRIVPEAPGRVSISGRAQYFPANTPLLDGTVEVWEVDGRSGARLGRRPRATFTIGEDGNWGPVRVDPRKHYELAATRPEDGLVSHFYFEPWVRSSHLVRLNVSPADSPLGQVVERGDAHAVAVVQRQKEWWGETPPAPEAPEGEAPAGASVDNATRPGQVPEVDSLTVQTRPRPVRGWALAGPSSPRVEVVNAATAPYSASTIALITWDDGADKASKTDAMIQLGAFLSGVDVFYPATPPGTITFRHLQRGERVPQVINTPNWPSSDHGVSVQFRDFVASQGGTGGPGRQR